MHSACMQEVAGEAVVEDEDDEEEAPDAPEPPPLAWPAPLEEALVDEELPASAWPHADMLTLNAFPACNMACL